MKSYQEILELDRIYLEIAKYAKINLAKERILNLEIFKQLDELLNEQNITKELDKFIDKYGTLSLDNIFDLFGILDRATKEQVLKIEDFYLIKLTLEAFQILSKYKNIANEEFPLMKVFLDNINCPKSFKDQLDKIIFDSDNIYDNSSDELKRLRRLKIKKEEEIKAKLDSLLSRNKEIMSEGVLAFRNNRYLLPIKTSYKYQLGGIVHDVSASGNTSFVEPQLIVELNLELNKIIENEKDEVYRILKNLSNICKVYADDITVSLSNAIELDFYSAKAIYGREINGKYPILSSDYQVKVEGARHLLIDSDKVIANDFFLEDNKKILLISGPNAGGKTVLLKTFGLIVVLAQLGLALPTAYPATLPIFQKIYIDIGDEQSLEQSLSTFSSHMKKIIDITNNIDSSSLILIDEIGAGTDPKEGETLAMALLDYINEKKATALVTTHYSNLKTFALTADYMKTGSMIFDEESLKSTYKLTIGRSGKSYAFQIASALGLKLDIINNAEKYLEKFTTNSERLEKILNDRLIEQENEMLLFEKTKEELEEQLKKNKLINEELNNSLLDINNSAAQKIEELIEDALINIETYVEEFKNKNVSLPEIIDVKKKIKDQQLEDITIETTSNYEPKVGDYVLVKSLNQKGLITDVKKNKYIIDTGIFSLQSEKDDLELTAKEEKKKIIKREIKIHNVPSEVNLIGLRVHEAEDKLNSYLDSARVANLKQVRVIHGFGTGALKNAVHELLSTKKFILSYNIADYNAGGAGATVVIFK